LCGPHQPEQTTEAKTMRPIRPICHPPPRAIIPPDDFAAPRFHARRGARFITVNDSEAVADYGDPIAEHAALRENRRRARPKLPQPLVPHRRRPRAFPPRQVTNDVKRLRVGEGCYAALVTAKGKMQSDLNIFCLQDELLLDFEPGITPTVAQRLEQFIVADDVQVLDVSPLYGLLSVQGPKAETVRARIGFVQRVGLTIH